MKIEDIQEGTFVECVVYNTNYRACVFGYLKKEETENGTSYRVSHQGNSIEFYSDVTSIRVAKTNENFVIISAVA